MLRVAEFRKAGQKAHYSEELAKMPEIDVVNLNIISVHMSGRIHRWNVLIHRGARVSHALRAIISRSHATRDPLPENQVVLAEILHGKIYRFFEPDQEIALLREGDTLACYEVAEPEAFGIGTQIEREWHDNKSEDSEELVGAMCGVIVNVRQQSSRMFFKDDRELGDACDLHGVPALLCVSPECTGAEIYGKIKELLGTSNRNTLEPVADFNIFLCKEKNEVVSGGEKLLPDSSKMPMKRHSRGGSLGMWHCALAAEWSAEAELPAWTLQQIGEDGASLEERSLQIFVGFDMPSFVSQFQFLWDERRRLTAENRSLFTWAGGKEEQIGKLRVKVAHIEHFGTRRPGHGDPLSNAMPSSPGASREGDFAQTLAQSQQSLAYYQQENKRLQQELELSRKAHHDLAEVVMQQRVQIDKLGRELDGIQGWRARSSAEASTYAASPSPPPQGSRMGQASRLDETPTPLAYQTPTPGPNMTPTPGPNQTPTPGLYDR